MNIYRSGALWLALLVSASAAGQNTSLTRAEVAAVKAKLVAVQQAMGVDPEGYVKESEEFYLPTDVNPAEGAKYWPIGSSVSVRYTDRAVREGVASAEQAAKDFEARYAAAVASGDPQAIVQMTQEMTRISQLAAAAGLSGRAKQDMTVEVRFNMNPYVGIDPDAVVFEAPGVIALRDTDLAGEEGRLTVYLDPVGLHETETLSKIELRTPEGGVENRTGVFNVTITLSGTLADLESWARRFDTASMLAVIDAA